jgi:hypothetical protein
MIVGTCCILALAGLPSAVVQPTGGAGARDASPTVAARRWLEGLPGVRRPNRVEYGEPEFHRWEPFHLLSEETRAQLGNSGWSLVGRSMGGQGYQRRMDVAEAGMFLSWSPGGPLPFSLFGGIVFAAVPESAGGSAVMRIVPRFTFGANMQF